MLSSLLISSAVQQLLWYASSCLCIAVPLMAEYKSVIANIKFDLILSFSVFGIVFNSLIHFAFYK